MILILLVFISFSLSTVNFFLTQNVLQKEYTNTLQSKANDSAVIIQERLSLKLSQLESIANQEVIQSGTWSEQKVQLDKDASHYEYDDIAIVDLQGQAHYTDEELLDLNDRSYIQEALTGKSVMSDIIISRKSNEPALMIATPIFNNNNMQGLLLARIDGHYLSEIVSDIKYNESGFSYIANDDGQILAHPDYEIVKQETNFLKLAETDPSYVTYADVTQTVINNGNGNLTYTDNTEKKMIAYSNIPTTNWIIVTGIDYGEINKSLNQLFVINIIICNIFIWLGVAIAIPLSRSISKSIKKVEQNGYQLAAGDFTHPVDEKLLTRNDELGKLGKSFEDMRINLKKMIEELRGTSDHIVASSTEMHSSSSQVAEATEHIASTMEEIATSAQASAQASSQTNVAMNETNAGLHRITQSANHVFEIASQSNEIAQSGNEVMSSAKNQMEQIHDSVDKSAQLLEELAAKNEEVRNFVDIISSIASETNLLALNASIEAARAGDEGRGFAVIAQQVHKLAEQSQLSAKEAIDIVEHITSSTTKVMLAMQKGTSEVGHGVIAIQNAEQAFGDIKNSMQKMTNDLEEISAASEQLAAASDEVSGQMTSMNDISQHTATSSENILAATEEQMASLQQVASASNELKDIAMRMNDNMNKFKIK